VGVNARLCVALLLVLATPAQAGGDAPGNGDERTRAYAAAMAGRKAVTLAAVQAQLSAAAVPADASGWDLTQQYAALVRFGLWDEMIALEPPAGGAGLTVGYLYGRGFALAARGRAAEAQQMLDELQALAASLPASTKGGANRLRDLVAVAEPVIAARMAASAGDNARAAQWLRAGVAAEDRLVPGVPPDWFFPVRQLLGAQLLIAAQAPEAEAVYREDLARNPRNGWSLYGLSLALAAQGHTALAAQVRHEQQLAWTRADVALPASAFWYAGVDTASCECEHRALSHGQPGGQLLRAQHETGVD
jgi:tetratricopeptide (TPR) repeat protein